jgi:hypothetical protein
VVGQAADERVDGDLHGPAVTKTAAIAIAPWRVVEQEGTRTSSLEEQRRRC